MCKVGNLFKGCFTGRKYNKKERSNHAYSLTNKSEFISSFSDGITRPETPKEKQAGSFPMSPPGSRPILRPGDHAVLESWTEQRKAKVVAAAKLSRAVTSRRGRAVEVAAAVMIQSAFRSYLARKALRALKGLVKVQALVRGYLVRKQTTATLHCMQSLATAQARARSQRTKMTAESNPDYWTPSNPRKSADRMSRSHPSYEEIDWGMVMDENIRIVEMDLGESNRSTTSRKSFPTSSHHPPTAQQTNPRSSSKGSVATRAYNSRQDLTPSALVDSSPRARSMRFDDYFFDTTHSSPRYSYSSAASVSDHPPNPQQTHERVLPNRNYTKQELKPSALVVSNPRAESARFVDYYLDTARSSPHASYKPEYPSYINNNAMAPAKTENAKTPRKKLGRSRSAPRTGGDLGRTKAPQAATRQDYNGDPWLAKLARVSDNSGKAQYYGSSTTVYGRSRSTWK